MPSLTAVQSDVLLCVGQSDHLLRRLDCHAASAESLHSNKETGNLCCAMLCAQLKPNLCCQLLQQEPLDLKATQNSDCMHKHHAFFFNQNVQTAVQQRHGGKGWGHTQPAAAACSMCMKKV